ncbi:MAG: DNA repair protein RecO [Planctomycetes bacterium]|nr:DNA repair protein RecO [Planctomycetota bacterium]
MSSEKSLAIVLRLVEFSETSVIATLFTEDFGKITALAKGARRPKGPFEAALDLLAACRIVFIHKSSDALDLLTEAKLERRFRAATRNLSHLYAGYYVAELLQDLTDDGDPHPQLFQAANQTLTELDDACDDDACDVARTILRFEMIALRELGHLPSFDRCVGCGGELPAEGRIAFGQLAGGVLCRECRAGQRQVVSVSSGVIRAFREFADPSESWRRTELDRGLRGELRGVLNHYLTNMLGKKLRMHRYLGVLAE